HEQMAQSAADAAALSAIMSVFDGTNAFGTSSHTCTTSDPLTPCLAARNNGFGSTASDVVAFDFPTDSSFPGVSFSTSGVRDSPNVIRVTITRTVNTGLMRLLGSSSSTVKAIAVAAIVDVLAPVPVLVLHPTADKS